MTALRTVGRYLVGRSRRREFWICVVAYWFLQFGTLLIDSEPSRSVATWTMQGVWILIATRRLRAMGWPVWIAAVPVVALAALQFGVKPMELSRTQLWGLYQILITTMSWTWMALVLLLGLWPSRRARPPAPEVQAEVFG